MQAVLLSLTRKGSGLYGVPRVCCRSRTKCEMPQLKIDNKVRSWLLCASQARSRACLKDAVHSYIVLALFTKRCSPVNKAPAFWPVALRQLTQEETQYNAWTPR